MTTDTMTYRLVMRDDCSGDDSVDLDHRPTETEIESICEDWVSEGDWGTDGASVTVYWSLVDDGGDGDEIASG